MATLRIVKGPEKGRSFTLPAAGATIGRDGRASDIVLKHEGVSRRHAKVFCDERGEFFIQDLKSRNTTFLNGKDLQEFEECLRPLRHKDHVRICAFVLVFHADGSSDTSFVEVVNDSQPTPKITSTIDLHDSDSDDEELQKSAQARLKALLQISDDLANMIEVKEVLPKVLDSLLNLFTRAQRGFILLQDGVDPNGEGEELAVAKGRDGLDAPIRVPRSILDHVMRRRQGILTPHAGEDERFQTSHSVTALDVRSAMCVPILGAERRPLGVIHLDVPHRESQFQAEDLHVLASVARQVGIVIENARLHEVALEQERLKHNLDRLKHDLQVARDVQKGLLPGKPPVAEGYAFFDLYRPAEQVGGDFFDYVYLPGDRLAIVVGDVAGEGIPAALLMARTSAEARYFLMSEMDPAQAMRRLNASLHANVPEGRFVTLAAAVLDLQSHRLTVVNAAHWPPLLRTAVGQVTAVKAAEPNFALGWFREADFHSAAVELSPGDCVLMFTDGLTEAKNLGGAMYGNAALNRAMAAGPADPLLLGQTVYEDMHGFVGNLAAGDDMCLLCFGRVGRA